MKPSERFEPESNAEMSGDSVIQLLQLFDQHGIGSIQGYLVKCISAEWTVQFHAGYELDEHDYHDVSALCKRFGIALPVEYERFTQEGTE
jgi:hypothetical protein